MDFSFSTMANFRAQAFGVRRSVQLSFTIWSAIFLTTDHKILNYSSECLIYTREPAFYPTYQVKLNKINASHIFLGKTFYLALLHLDLRHKTASFNQNSMHSRGPQAQEHWTLECLEVMKNVDAQWKAFKVHQRMNG